MIISVASGKGGTGKTLIATSLALSLRNKAQVQLLDCDVEEPNDHIFIRPVIDRTEAVGIPVPVVDEAICTRCGRCAEVCAFNAIAVAGEYVLTFPELCHGCGACSYLCPEKAITEENRETGVIESGKADSIDFTQGRLTVGEAMAPPVIRKVKERTNNDGVAIIDAPPGTSCPVVESVKGSDFCLLVTEPTPFGLNDLKLAVATMKELGIPCGVVLNRAGNGDKNVIDYCESEYIPVLMTVPLDMEIARLYSRGITLAEGIPAWQKEFIGLFDKITEIVDERNRCPER
ncbi:MAG TPA: P-loop NTPase [Dehalococcoidia bacterium]|nr:P-loop NTPase [Dehalococcoidia bacterium]